MSTSRFKFVLVFLLFFIGNLITGNFGKVYADDEINNYFEKAKKLSDKKQYDRAITQLMNIIEKTPENIEARLLIGEIKFQQMNYEEAFDQVREILIRNKEDKRAIELGNKVFEDVLTNRDFNSYRNFLFYSCNYIFNSPNPIIEKFLVHLLENHKNRFLNSNNQISEKGNITIYTLSTVYSSFNNSIQVLAKYFPYKNLEGGYPARKAIENIKEEEKIRKNPELLKSVIDKSRTKE